MKFIRILSILVASLATCCGSSSNSDVSISGTVSGRTFNSRSGAFVLNGNSELFMVIAEHPDICGIAQRGEDPTGLLGKFPLDF